MMDEKKTMVYMVLRKEDSKTLGADVAPKGSPIYVGITDHESRLNLLKRGNLSFEKYQIHVLHDNLSRAEAEAEEMRLISEYGRLDLGTGMLNNLTDGGDKGGLGVVWSDEQKAKLSASQKATWDRGTRSRAISDEQKEKLRIASTGKKHTPESRAKMSAAQKGRVFSPETRAKMSAAQKGRPGRIPSAEEREKRSAGLRHVIYVLRHKDGRICTTDNLKEFCEQQGLKGRSALYKVMDPDDPHRSYKGWKIARLYDSR